MFEREEYGERPKIITGKNIGYAVLSHILLFLSFYLFAIPFKSKPVIIPIDLTVVVNENLDGEENEPPPEKPVEPTPPPPPEPPKPVVKPPEPPKVEEKREAVEMVKEKKNEEKKPKVEERKPEKPKEVEKPKPPEKTKEELMKERIEKMRKSAKDVKTPPKKVDPPKNNGKTDKKTLSDKEIQDLLNKGYKPGATTNLTANDEQLCLSLIKQRFDSKWDKPAWTDTLKPMVIRCRFGAGGKLVEYKLIQSSGDRAADQSILRAASLVGSVPGLTPEFIKKHSGGIDVRFTVKPQ